MTKLYFSFSNIFTIGIFSNSEIVFSDKEMVLLKARVPGISLLLDTDIEPDLIVEHNESSNLSFMQEKDKCTIYDTWEGKIPDDIYHLVYGMVRSKCLSMKIYPIHSACIGFNEHVLLVGHSGSGKTSILIESLQDPRIHVFSGDKTFISFEDNILKAIAGTKSITIRKRDLESLDDKYSKNFIDYGDRIVLKEVKSSSVDDGVNIKAIVLVRVNDYIQEIKKDEMQSSLHTLYPFFLDTIKADVILDRLGQVYIGDFSIDCRKYLSDSLSKALTKIPVYSATGSSKFICEEILKLL